jgi:hypothetical protein
MTPEAAARRRYLNADSCMSGRPTAVLTARISSRLRPGQYKVTLTSCLDLKGLGKEPSEELSLKSNARIAI